MITINEDAVAQDYYVFLKEKDIPPLSSKIDIDSLPIRAFIAWRAMTSDSYKSECVADPLEFKYIVTYYDMYEIPVCYTQIRFCWIKDLTTMQESLHFSVRPKSINETDKDYIKRFLELYLLSIGFLTYKRYQSLWTRIKKWFTFRNSD